VGVHVNDVIGVVTTADGRGYWLMGRDGGVFALGDATFLGSLPSVGATVGNVTSTTAGPGSSGYYVVTGDGSVFAFGTAVYGVGGAGAAGNVGIAVAAS
jgi:hypothetical protein